MAIVFIVDLQPSMGTNDCPIASPEGSPCITRLDCAKACVEFFLRRQRQQPPQCLLVTTTSGNSHVNVGWVSTSIKHLIIRHIIKQIDVYILLECFRITFFFFFFYHARISDLLYGFLKIK